ncbi:MULTISPECIES: AAA family ATPase [unclassified Polaribacter]|uniref:AAA family ATPase n=1 Tax=unclassified Polaribacter TaxID=196858 RepID=UPI0011BE9118|nr:MULTISPECIES: AAA family ATPase [unclassified Polaribacter]TXD50185.1 AAA family ATPase [Polaribacter sp. IC063]TXD56127.1 AAA family ATPase [Polaribacter sp. IC066]
MTEKYKETFLQSIEVLERETNSEFNLKSYVTEICEHQSESQTLNLYKSLDNILKIHDTNKIKNMSRDVKNCLLLFFGAINVSSIIENYLQKNKENFYSIEELLDQLNVLIGLNNVKQQVKDLIALQKIQSLRKENGLQSFNQTLHMAFIGNPGTGKTTVARIVGRIYKHLGLLSKGHFIEVSRTDLIAGYQGQTALKVKKVIKKSIGGVLFIDEAYSITENENSDSYGKECLTELTKALEDYRDDLVVIVAGYKKPMDLFFKSNQGLQSRFNTFIEFEDFNDLELYEILKLKCNQNNYILTDSSKSKIKQYLTELTREKQDDFANGRLVRNMFDNIILQHAKRVFKIENPSIKDLKEIISNDICTGKK